MNDMLACISSIPDTREWGGGSYSQRNSFYPTDAEDYLKRERALQEGISIVRNLADNPIKPNRIQQLMNECHFGLLQIKDANEWIEDALMRPDPVALWKSLWYEEEICCLFADSNLGKSVYACNIANEISKTRPVLYCDFELTDKQFQIRFTNTQTQKRYGFNPNFKRAELSDAANYCEPCNFEEAVIKSIEDTALGLNIKTIIIDNLTWICNSSDNGDAAGILMARLVQLKKNHGWSILVIAHTPKRSLRNPIDQNTLAGSKKLMNFFDSAFAIGRSAKDENLRYIKQIKCRSSAFEYGEDNVIVADIVKEPNGYLHFNEIGHDRETNHLREKSDNDVNMIKNNIIELRRKGKSYREIAAELGISVAKVHRTLTNTDISK